MADFFDDFDGPADQAIEARTGWVRMQGSNAKAFTTGTGALKTTDTANTGTAGLGTNTGAQSHFAEVELGNMTLPVSGVQSVAAIVFVKGNASNVYMSQSMGLDYSSNGKFALRQDGYPADNAPGGNNNWLAPFVPGTLVRMEAKMQPDGQAQVEVFFDGVKRIGPCVSKGTAVKVGTYAGVWPRSPVATEIIRSFRAGELVQDVTAPTLTGDITVTSKTHNAIVAQCPVATDNVAVTGYQWRINGGAWTAGTRDFTFTGLTASTAYTLDASALDAMGNASTALSLAVTTNAPPPADTTPPVVSGAAVTVTNATRANGSITTNEAGTARAVLTSTAAKPTAAAVKSGAGALATASAPAAVGSNNGTLAFTALQPETSYFMHAIVEDEAGNLSAVATSAQFTTPAGLPEGFFVDSFDGASGQSLVDRGWLAAGNSTFASVNGNGGVRSTNVGKTGNPAAFYIDTLSTSHFSETVVGEVIGDGGGPKSGTTTSYCWVNLPTNGTLNDAVYIDYSLAYTGIYVRNVVGGSVVGSCGHALQRGDTLRLQKKMALDNLSYEVRLYVNGALRAGPYTLSAGVANRGAGFRIETQVEQEDVILSASVGKLAMPPPDIVAPVLTNCTATATGAFTAQGRATTDEYAIGWAALTTTATKPSAAALKAGTGFAAAHSGSMRVDDAMADHYLFVGLQPSTTYYMHLAAEDLTGNLSSVVTSAPFTTQHLGVLGSVILATTGGGAAGAGFLYDKVGPGDGEKYFHYVITRQPALGTLDAYPDGSFSYSGDTDSFEYSLYKNGVFVATYTVALNLGTVVADTTPPVLTGAIEVVSKNDVSVSLRSPIGTDNVGVTGYEWSRDGGSTWTLGGRDFTFSGLTASTAYGFRVRAKDAADNKSAPALTISVTTEAPPVATVMHCRMVISANGLPSAVGLSGIAWAFWNSPTPVIGSAADYMGTGLTVVDQDGQGMVNIPLPNTPLRTGEVGVVELVINDGTPTGANNRALKKAVAVGP